MASSSGRLVSSRGALSSLRPRSSGILPRTFSTTSTLGPRSTTKSPDAARRKALIASTKAQEIQVLPPTQYHKPTHGHHVATITFTGYSSIPVVKENLVFFSDFAIRAAYAMGMPVSGAAPVKVRQSLWTVLKGPFAHKKAQENFERLTSRRVVRVYDTNEEVVEKWLHYLRIHQMLGISMRAEIFRMRPVGIGQQTYEAAKKAFEKSNTKATTQQAISDKSPSPSTTKPSSEATPSSSS
ncbi:unnamed protein product [Sympodiomycopsis kandeliae]